MGISELELVSRKAKKKDAIPVLFVHGIFCGAWIWEEHFLQWFADNGYHAYAVSLRGHGQSYKPSNNQHSLNDYVQDLKDAIQAIEMSHKQPPILVGHSMGGMVVQRFLSDHESRGAVLMNSIPPQGMLPLSWQSFWQDPVTTLEMSQSYLMPELTTTEQLKRYLFSGPIDQAKLERWLGLLKPESQTLLWDMSCNNLPNPFEVAKTPIAVVGSRHDKLVPKLIVSMTAATYGCTPYWIDAGHGGMLEHNWQESAQIVSKALTDVLMAEEEKVGQLEQAYG